MGFSLSLSDALFPSCGVNKYVLKKGGAMDKKTMRHEKFLEETRQYWSKEYGRELTLAEAEEIYRNVASYLRVLERFYIQSKQE